MSPDVNHLSEDDIAASNVLPTYEASLRFGATEAELERELGWRRSSLTQPEARVSGSSTALHLELMFRKPRFPQFIVEAAAAHDESSLGVVGLACRALPTLGAALACHARFQRLTNRTATFAAVREPDGVHLREQRLETRLGALLLSDYSMLVAHRLLTLLSPRPLRISSMHSRREELSAAERSAFERAVGAPVKAGARASALVLEPGALELPVKRADPQLERYFVELLERSLPSGAPAEAPILSALRSTVRARIHQRQPTLTEAARELGLGSRTLQRRLSALNTSFQAVLDETLRALAEGYLRQPELTLAETAWLLGYEEYASFVRAVRRWHRTTPSALQQRVRQPARRSTGA